MDAEATNVQSVAAGRHGALGAQLRARRIERQVGLRELARRLQVSPSLISQIETGKLTPSVSTLFAIANELGISLDQLFSDGEQGTGSADVLPGADGPRSPQVGRRPAGQASSHAGRAAPSTALRRGATRVGPISPVSPLPPGPNPEPSDAGRHYPVQRAGDRRSITMATGVRWDRLTPAVDRDVDFLELTYEVGASSSEDGILMRHPGREYGIVLEGVLGITIAFDDYELRPGDSISFDSTVPHRFWNAGEDVVRAIWLVVGRQPPAGSATEDAVFHPKL